MGVKSQYLLYLALSVCLYVRLSKFSANMLNILQANHTYPELPNAIALLVYGGRTFCLRSSTCVSAKLNHRRWFLFLLCSHSQFLPIDFQESGCGYYAFLKEEKLWFGGESENCNEFHKWKKEIKIVQENVLDIYFIDKDSKLYV